ncbi:MAG: DUF1501 domain-containing protein [Gemmatimonadetes bacterium]|nr:DUF1501 domain-containing protein [Gemmatimonadota bacterium]|tara:strand:- start:2721 stop:4196 length:1476 start_codon:yes stop_codon:yes gene_type:complete
MSHCHKHERTFWPRKDFLMQSGGGVAGLAFAHLLQNEGVLAAGPEQLQQCDTPFPGAFEPRPPHFEPRATAVISLFMSGGVSQVDTFDYKPALKKYAGEPLHGKVDGNIAVRQGMPGPLMPSPFEFKQYGESGIHVSELFPHLAQHVDEMAFINSVYGRSNDHIQATYEMQTGQIRMGFPSVGSWVTYGLGSQSSSLPAFVVMTDWRGGPLGGPNDWGAGFMPAEYQGTRFRSTGDPIVDLARPEEVSSEAQRARLDALAQLNEIDMDRNPGNSELAARISSYELAYRMQGCAPEAIDTASESDATKKLYGLDSEITEPFGRQLLMARRLVERGVRFVQVFHGGAGNQNTDTWDAHSNLVENHTQHAAESDLPIAGLLADLKSRGLLDSTLIVWHGEFGRMPISQRGVGRDHNPGTMTAWMAGAGIQGGQKIGASDEFGYKAEQQPVSSHDMHATMLNLLGLDHDRLRYRYSGRDWQLTDIDGKPIPQIIG